LLFFEEFTYERLSLNSLILCDLAKELPS
jgi:hypothetical protein